MAKYPFNCLAAHEVDLNRTGSFEYYHWSKTPSRLWMDAHLPADSALLGCPTSRKNKLSSGFSDIRPLKGENTLSV